jgi:hypothetical protein
VRTAKEPKNRGPKRADEAEGRRTKSDEPMHTKHQAHQVVSTVIGQSRCRTGSDALRATRHVEQPSPDITPLSLGHTVLRPHKRWMFANRIATRPVGKQEPGTVYMGCVASRFDHRASSAARGEARDARGETWGEGHIELSNRRGARCEARERRGGGGTSN